MNLRKFSGAAFVQWLVIIVLAILIICAVAALTSCRTCKQTESSAEVKYVYAGDSCRNVSVRVDSVFVRDSVFTLVKGDSVLIDRTRNVYHESLRVDTVVKLKTRTVYITRTERITVAPKKPPWDATLKIIIFGIAGYLIGKLLVRMYYKFYRRK